MPRKRSRQLHAARTAAARALFAVDIASRRKRGVALANLVEQVRVLLDLTLSDTDRAQLSGYIDAHPGAARAPDHWLRGDPAPADSEEAPGAWPRTGLP